MYVRVRRYERRVTHFVFHEEHVRTWPSDDQFKIPELGIDWPRVYRNAGEKNIACYGTIVIYLFGGNGTIERDLQEGDRFFNRL